MELIAIVLIFLVIGGLFPGGSGGGGPAIGDALASLAAFVVVGGGIFLFWGYSMAGIILAAEWLGIASNPFVAIFALIGPIAVPMTAMGIYNGISERKVKQGS